MERAHETEGAGPHDASPQGNWLLLGLGTNQAFEGLAGQALLEKALASLAASGIRLLGRSAPWASAAWPDPSQPAFVNMVALVDAGAASPRGLLEAVLAIEKSFGRVRGRRWAARTLDIDLLDFAGRIVKEEGLCLPHPRMAERNFVLAPLAQLAPWWHHPVLGKSAACLLRDAPSGALKQLRD